jgi:hypothetical protein
MFPSVAGKLSWQDDAGNGLLTAVSEGQHVIIREEKGKAFVVNAVKWKHPQGTGYYNQWLNFQN